MNISKKGLEIVKHFEGLYLEAYLDPVDVWTIGYGHTGESAESGNVITEMEAENLLQDDMRESERYVKKYINVNLTQYQFDALVSFTFNVGGGALARSTLRKKLNSGDYEGAANEFLRWDKGTVNGKKKVLKGLARRRRSERHYFTTGEINFYEYRGIVDPDAFDTYFAKGNARAVYDNAPLEPANDADFLIRSNLYKEGEDESILRDLAQENDIEFPVERLISLRNQTYAQSRPTYWAVLNFDLKSSKPRLFVLDVKNKEVASYLCAHGSGSEKPGTKEDGYAEIFSNVHGSHASSLGIYRCAETYIGSNGYSLRLDGLEDANSNARGRVIVMHGADYVSEKYIDQYKRLGLSHGCPAVDHKYAKKIIDQLKYGSFLIHWFSP